MFSRFYAIRPTAWWLFGSLLMLAMASAIIRSTNLIPASTFLYVLQPGMALAVLFIAIYLTKGVQDRVKHRSDKAFLVGSVLAVWFVLYFLSGFITTYTNNSLVTSPRSILLNIWSFGVVGFAIEYARHGLMLLAGRRNFIWFGSTVAIVLAVQQMNLGLIPSTHGLESFVKLGVSDFIPAIVSSFLLTYLAIAGGLPSMLVFRLGLVAATILPPIIPKYDWYLQGVSLLLLAIVTYLVIDRNQQTNQADARHRPGRHQARAYDLMSLITMVGLALFMTGTFSYKPTTIVSNSMKPVYSRGCMVIVEKIDDPMDIKVGDIVQYQRTSVMITHRVIAIDVADDGSGERVFITQGDNSPSQDPPVPESQIFGVIRAQIPFIGYPTVWLREVSS